MESTLRAIFERGLLEALHSNDPCECIIRHFSSHSMRRRHGGRPPKKGVDIEKRKSDLKAFLEEVCMKDDNCSILLEDVQTRFNEYRRVHREERVAWNDELLSAIHGLYGNKIFGLRWENESDDL